MSVLDDIIAQKKLELPSMKADPTFRTEKKSFVSALRARRPSLIAEVKPKSPSAGRLLEEEMIPDVVKLYNENADAISVLCDEKFFGGGFSLLKKIRGVTTLPILAKEFMIDTKQIDAANESGADAILLIAAILEKSQLVMLAEYAIKRNMSVLLEIHEELEIERIPNISHESMVIGINSRNLSTLKMDLQTAERIAPLVRKKFPEHVLIAESGMSTAADTKKLSRVVDGFLIGTGLIKAESRDSILFAFDVPKIKFCGITREEDARLCDALNINYVGFNFVPYSKRKVSPEHAKELRRFLKKTEPVGIFLEEQISDIESICKTAGIKTVQIYRETQSDLHLPSDFTVIHAFRGIPSEELLLKLVNTGNYVLLDGPENGKEADLEAISKLPVTIRKRLFIAGGLTPRNAGMVAKNIRPFAVDTASGIESAPGIKDKNLMEQFIHSLNDV